MDNQETPSRFWNVILKARAKSREIKWDVQHCNARPSGIRASKVIVLSAPGNFSPADFGPAYNRNGQIVFVDLPILVEHQKNFRISFFLGFMRRMPFLPEKFSCPQKSAGRISQRTTLPH